MADPAHLIPIAPIHTAPVEIIGEILCYALSGPLEHGHDQRVSSILRVCRRWNQIAMQSKEFRSHQFVPRPGADTESTQALLDYTAPHPIRICTYAHIRRDPGEPDPEDVAHHRVIALPTHPILGPLAITLRNVARIREVRLVGCEDDIGLDTIFYKAVRSFFQRLGPASASADASVTTAIEEPLEELALEGMAPGEGSVPMDLERLEINGLLENAHLIGFLLYAFPIDPRFNFMSVREITLQSCGLDFTSAAIFRSPVLTTVNLTYHYMVPVSWENELEEWGRIVNALERMTMVKTLRLQLARPRIEQEHFGSYPPRVYVLPSLQQFIIGDHPITVIKLLNHIRFPHSASLFLSFYLDRKDFPSTQASDISSALTEYFPTSSAPFRSLIIEGNSEDRDGCSWVLLPPAESGRGSLRVGTATYNNTYRIFSSRRAASNDLRRYVVDLFTLGGADLLKDITHVSIRLPGALSAKLWSRILVSLPRLKELLISGDAVAGWMDLCLKASNDRNARPALKSPILPRLRIVDTTFHGPEVCSRLISCVLLVAGKGCTATLDGCSFIQIERDTWRQANHLMRGGHCTFNGEA
ncbi:hypothetical protein FA95DRAFT_1139503 [Auriscalpium vulgare]|uniref:Uncharacterized protein n=1 Tax=Auriscalpium vulgare TaxID=40419 RepID=A0ACB8RVL1_9AGAM|nr:hypothetical protein FA95DRAFT_1139503 [Auriscalpium vulgare]